MDDIQTIENISNKQDFLDFLDALIGDCKNNRQNWTNQDLITYLEAMQNWVDDMEGFFQHLNLKLPPDINWSVFAHILVAAKKYE